MAPLNMNRPMAMNDKRTWVVGAIVAVLLIAGGFAAWAYYYGEGAMMPEPQNTAGSTSLTPDGGQTSGVTGTKGTTAGHTTTTTRTTTTTTHTSPTGTVYNPGTSATGATTTSSAGASPNLPAGYTNVNGGTNGPNSTNPAVQTTNHTGAGSPNP